MSNRVAVMTIASDSTVGVGDGLWALQTAAKTITRSAPEIRKRVPLLPKIKKGERCCFTSNPPFRETKQNGSLRLSFFFLRRSFFGPSLQKTGGHRPPLQTRANEVDIGRIFWLLAFLF